MPVGTVALKGVKTCTSARCEREDLVNQNSVSEKVDMTDFLNCNRAQHDASAETTGSTKLLPERSHTM